jgi:hypothetical protein
MGQLKVAQAVLVSLKTEGPSLTLMQKLAGQESSRQWRKTRLEQKASRRMQRSAKKIKGEMDQNQRSFRPEREREMSVEDGEGRPVAPSGVEYPAPEIPEDPNERAKLKREVMPGSPTSEAKAKPKVSPQQVMRRGGLSIASGPPLTKANPSPTQEGVKRTAEEGTGDLESIEPLLSKRRFQPQHQQRRVHQTQEH